MKRTRRIQAAKKKQHWLKQIERLEKNFHYRHKKVLLNRIKDQIEQTGIVTEMQIKALKQVRNGGEWDDN